MRRLLFCLAGVFILAACAVATFSYGWYERETAKAEEFLSVISPKEADDVYQKIEDRLNYVSIVPWLFDSPREEVKIRRLSNLYWQGMYIEVINRNNQTDENNPNLGFITSNAFYRSVLGSKDRRIVLEYLDKATNGYKSVVTADGNNFDAAYNYEYLLRVRDLVSRNKLQLLLNGSGQAMHGSEGLEAEGKGMDQLKIHVPSEVDEIKHEPNDPAGKGNAERMKG